MQAQSIDKMTLFIFSEAFIGITGISVLGFLEFLQPLTYTFHQLRYLTSAKKQHYDHKYQDYFKRSYLSHGCEYLFMQMYKMFVKGLKYHSIIIS